MTREQDAHRDAGRVFNKISRAVDGEIHTNIIGACAGVIVESMVDSAPDLATALRAFDAMAELTRKKLIEDWTLSHES
jgi:hypothetical protein